MINLEKWQLDQMVSLPLEAKIIKSQLRIREWYDFWHGEVYISFSGGKDSTVLEYPEIKEFVKATPSVELIRPEMSFITVLENYGYPVISKEQSQYIYDVRNTKSKKMKNIRLNGNKWGQGKVSEKWKFMIDSPFKISDKCCNIMKKKPFRKYEKETGRKPYIGTMVEESSLRMQGWLKDGCNAFTSKRPISKPMSFWTEDDVWAYIKKYDIPYSSIYDMGWERTGCMWCLYGIQYEEYPNRLQRMQTTHPQLHHYCLNKLGIKEVLDYMNIPYDINDKRNIKLKQKSLFN